MNPHLFRIVTGHAFSQACMAGMRMGLPLYALKQEFGAANVGVLLGFFSVSNLLLSVPIGRMVDRKGLHLPWRLSVWLAVGASLLCAAFPNFWGMAVCAMLVGTSAALCQLSAQHYGGTIASSSQQRTEVMGWMMLAPSVASLIGPLGVGLLLDHAGESPADYRSLLAVCAMVALLAFVSRWLVRGIPEAHQSARAKVDASRHHRWELLKTPGLMVVLALNALIFTCWTAYLLIVPMLCYERGLSASTIGTMFGAFALSSALVRPLLPRLAARLPHRPLIVASCVLSGLAIVGFPLMSSAWGYLLCSVIYGLTMGCVQVLLMTMLTGIVPKESQGEALGLRLLTFSASNVAVPVTLGAIGAFMGVGAMFALTAGVAIGASGLALRVRHRED